MMHYEIRNNVALLAIDDGKANVVGHSFLDSVNRGLDRAEEEKLGALILRGRAGVFSGGFDLGEFKKGPDATRTLVRRGLELLIRLYSFPRPVVAACTGHAVAMGAFIVMACDTRVGARGEFKLSAPETALGMDLPPVLVELIASRISPRHMTRVAIQAEVYDPEHAVEAGFLDEVVDPAELDSRARALAERLAQLPMQYGANKLSVRARTLEVMRANLEELTGAG
jgi:enoyl-CoA hydratase